MPNLNLQKLRDFEEYIFCTENKKYLHPKIYTTKINYLMIIMFENLFKTKLKFHEFDLKIGK